MAPAEGSPADEPREEKAPLSWPRAIAAEVRAHRGAYAVLLLFVVAGPLVTELLFPGAPRGVGLVGGVAFGAYAALCAMPGRFL